MTVIAVPREYTLHSSQVLKKNEISTVEDEKECCPKTLEQLVQEKKSAVTQMNPTYWMKEGGFDSSTNRWVLEDNSEIPINVVGDVSVHMIACRRNSSNFVSVFNRRYLKNELPLGFIVKLRVYSRAVGGSTHGSARGRRTWSS